jgi:hypothetical protein
VHLCLFSGFEVGLLCTIMYQFIIGLGNRDIMTKELSQVCLFLWTVLTEYFFPHKMNFFMLLC